MSELSIFSEIIVRHIEGVMLHTDLADMFDFMAMRGFKREQEYHALKEFCEMRGVSRYAINHINQMPNGQGAKGKDIISAAWYNATRYQVSENDRKSKTKELYSKWQEWEKETKELYEKKYKELMDLGAVASALKVKEIICDVDYELKCLERCMLEYSAVGWDIEYIMYKQPEIHDCYEKKMKDDIKVVMC